MIRLLESSGGLTGRDFFVLTALVLIVGVTQLVLDGFLFKDPPIERRQRELLAQATVGIGGQPHPKAVILCDQGLYPPLAALLFVDLFYRRRVLIWTGSAIQLFVVGRKARVNLVFQGSMDDLKVSRLHGLFGRAQVGPEKIWVNRRYFSDLGSITCEA